MRMRRRLMALAACGIAAVAVAAGATSAAPRATTQLTVAVWSDWQFVQRAADAYTKTHPNVKIKVSAIPGEQYFASLPRTLGSGGADITVLQVTGTGSYKGLVDEHALVDLSSIWRKQGLTRVMPAGVAPSYVSADGG